jgi:hypothetical protein
MYCYAPENSAVASTAFAFLSDRVPLPAAALVSSVYVPLDENERDACSLFFIFSFPPPHEYLTRKPA